VEAGAAQGVQNILDFFGNKLFERDLELEKVQD
jgi:hypothetical protein